jgi:hypothetical protein
MPGETDKTYMRCDDFIQSYSDFRDGTVTEESRSVYERHLAECARCRRYDRVVTGGVMLYSELPPHQVSPDFMPRLQHRIYHLEDATRLTTKRTVGSAALVAVAGVGFLAVTWLPFATRMSVEVQLPSVTVEAPAPAYAEESDLFRADQRLFPETGFLLPYHPTLDESDDLFTRFSIPVDERSYENPGVTAPRQLDSER